MIMLILFDCGNIEVVGNIEVLEYKELFKIILSNDASGGNTDFDLRSNLDNEYDGFTFQILLLLLLLLLVLNNMNKYKVLI